MITTETSIRGIVTEQLYLSPGEASDHDSLSAKYQMDGLDQAEIIIAIECELAIVLDILMKFDTIWQLIEAVEATA